MPIDKNMSDAMLGTFRQMVKDCTDKGYSGESFATMCNIMNEMEQLATNMNDFTAYSIKLTTNGYFMNFSNAYGKVLSEAATAQYASGNTAYNDDALLQQTINAYKDSLKKFGSDPDKTLLVKVVQDVIDIANSDVNYPTFLRMMIEQGLDKAMEGMIINRKYLEANVKSNDTLQYPPLQRRSTAMLNKYDELASKASFGIPNAVIFTLEQSKVTDDTEADLRRYQHIQTLWFNMFTRLHTWVDAHTKFAATDERFAGASASETQLNISRSKYTLPATIKIYEAQLFENYSITWEDIFHSESFLSECKGQRFNYTKDYILFVKNDVHPQCVSFQTVNPELIQKAESLYKKALY